MTPNLLGILTDLDRLGVALEIDGTQIFAIPAVAVPDELRERIRDAKPEILRFAEGMPDPNSLWQTALDSLEGNPDFPADVLEGLRAGVAEWASE